MGSIIEFKKGIYAERETDPEDTKYSKAFERLERLKDDIKRTIDILKDNLGKNLITCMGPLYYEGNTDPEITGYVSNYFRTFLEEILGRLESEEFTGSFMLSDVPHLLELAESTFNMGIPTNVAIPFKDSVITFIITRIGTEWIITNIYRNHENIFQHALEMAFENIGQSVEDAFDMTEDEQ